MSVAEKLTTVAENMPKVFEAGKQAEYDAFWDMFQGNIDDQKNYQYAFAGAGWGDNTFKPKYDIRPGTIARGLFREACIKNLKGCLESCGVELVLSTVENADQLFAYMYSLMYLPKIDLSSMTSGSNLCYSCNNLRSIEELRSSEKTTFNKNGFTSCRSLTRLIMVGTLATNGLDLHWSTNLDKESLLSIIGCLKDHSGTGGTWTVTFGTDNLAKLTDAEKAVATQKGWTLV